LNDAVAPVLGGAAAVVCKSTAIHGNRVKIGGLQALKAASYMPGQILTILGPRHACEAPCAIAFRVSFCQTVVNPQKNPSLSFAAASGILLERA